MRPRYTNKRAVKCSQSRSHSTQIYQLNLAAALRRLNAEVQYRVGISFTGTLNCTIIYLQIKDRVDSYEVSWLRISSLTKRIKTSTPSRKDWVSSHSSHLKWAGKTHEREVGGRAHHHKKCFRSQHLAFISRHIGHSCVGRFSRRVSPLASHSLDCALTYRSG